MSLDPVRNGILVRDKYGVWLEIYTRIGGSEASEFTWACSIKFDLQNLNKASQLALFIAVRVARSNYNSFVIRHSPYTAILLGIPLIYKTL